MVKIAFVIPYFGALPSFFDVFLSTCSHNKTIDFLLFTDQNLDSYKLPENVVKHTMTFADAVRLYKARLGSSIALNKPYKLCDFKPAIGYIYEDYLRQYDWWGHIDIDTVLGDLRAFLSDELFQKYDKIGVSGSCSLYRNDQSINCLFKKSKYGAQRWEEVLSDSINRGYDEYWSWTREDKKDTINDILKKENVTIYNFSDFFDVRTFYDNLYRVCFDGKIWHRYKKVSFGLVENGKAYCITKDNGKWNREEVAYIHFQKRIMDSSSYLGGDILCVPNRFISYDSANKRLLEKWWRKSMIHKVIDYSRMKYLFKKTKYKLAEKTYSLRHRKKMI